MQRMQLGSVNSQEKWLKMKSASLPSLMHLCTLEDMVPHVVKLALNKFLYKLYTLC